MKPFLPSLHGISDRYRRLLVFLLLNAPLVWGFLLLDLRGVDFSGLSAFYTATVLAGYYVLPPLLITSLVFLLLSPLGRTSQLVNWVLVSLYVFYLLLDALAYGVIKIHVDFFWLEYMFVDFGGLGLPESTVITAAGAFAVLLAIEYLIVAAARRLRGPRLLAPAVWLAAILAFGASQILHIVAYQRNDSRITSLTPRLPFYIPFTSHRHAAAYGGLLPVAVGEAAESPTQDEMDASLTYPLAPPTFAGPDSAATPNVMVILLESWRSDAMDDTLTPNIAALARESTVFTDHLSTGNQTTGGIFGLFYGLDPTYWTAVKANSTLIDNPVWIDAMTDRGYDFGIYAMSKFKRHKIADTIFRGMEIHEKFAGRDVPTIDDSMTDEVVGFLKDHENGGKPFFALTFYKSSHFNYEYPDSCAVFEPAKNLNVAFVNKDTDPTDYLNDYHNAVHYCDVMAGRILDELRGSGLMDDTIVIVTTDHGESFNDNRANYWGHGSNYTKFEVQVPLIIHFPDRAPQTIAWRTSHTDVAPTLMRHYFGCTSPLRDYSNGRDMLAPDAGPRPFVVASYVNHAFVLGDDVYEIYPLYTKKYTFEDVTAQPGRPQTALLKAVIEEINRFYMSKPE